MNIMYKIIKKCSFILCVFMLLSRTECFAIEIDFKFIIDTIGIPEFNKHGDRINEDVYNQYNIFVYSDPIAMYSKVNYQRFKAVKDKGKWTQDAGPYIGEGAQGEYYILGTSYNGDLVHNVYFPVDTVPKTSPESWQYIKIQNAKQSWNDQTKYKYIEQLEYMKNGKLLFDKLDFTNNTADSYNIVEYDIIPSIRGLEYFNLNTASTWRTMGIVTAKRKAEDGILKDVFFATKPMAANAEVNSILDVKYSDMNENEDTVEISIDYGAKVVNLNEYAKAEHIKQICSIIYINDKKIKRISGSKIVNISEEINFTISREECGEQESYPLKIKVFSYLYTEFSVDGLLTNTLEKNITIQISPKKINPVKNLELGVFKQNKNSLVVSPLNYIKEMYKLNSVGIIELGRYLAVIVNTDVKTDIIDEITIYINKVKHIYDIVDINERGYILKLKLEDEIGITLKDWNTLRESTQSYFEIRSEDLGTRKSIPNELEICVSVKKREYRYQILFDTISNYMNNINYNIY